MKNILFIAGRDQGYYFDPFIAACEKRGLHVYVLDQSLFPAKATINVTVDDGGKLGGFVDVLEWKSSGVVDIRLPITDISVAWYLRDGAIQATVSEETIEVRFTRNETKAALRSLFSVLKCPWVNREETIHFLSSNKLYQQLIARQCGLAIPRTLISNNPESVAEFSNPEQGLLLKSMGYIKLDEAGRYFLYSERFSHEELLEKSLAIHGCPIFAQEYVEKHYEHRVMVIGNRVLDCRIDSQRSEATKVDWRHYDFANVAHVQVELPRRVQENLLRFMREVGLQYGAIDLIETPEGEFVFLEVNPSGQWGWVADLAGLPITEAVAEMLEFL